MALLERPDTRVHYRVEGEGPPALLIQGAGVVGEGWRPQVDALRGRYRCAVMDNRGIGLSGPAPGKLSVEQMAGDALALMDALGWDRAHLVGHSIGGLVCQQLALDAPARVSSLTLMCTFHRGAEVTRLSWPKLSAGLRARIGSLSARRGAFLELVLEPEDLASADVDALAEELAAAFGRDVAESPPILMRQPFAAGRHDAYARLAELSEIPTLVMSATRDVLAPPKTGRLLAEAIPGARYLELEGAHGVPLRRPERVNGPLLEHLDAAEALRAPST